MGNNPVNIFFEFKVTVCPDLTMVFDNMDLKKEDIL